MIFKFIYYGCKQLQMRISWIYFFNNLMPALIPISKLSNLPSSFFRMYRYCIFVSPKIQQILLFYLFSSWLFTVLYSQCKKQKIFLTLIFFIIIIIFEIDMKLMISGRVCCSSALVPHGTQPDPGGGWHADNTDSCGRATFARRWSVCGVCLQRWRLSRVRLQPATWSSGGHSR